ncbi:MAG: hypothetical protein KDC01_00945 [Flavobacteriales bacterium]|jgi:hypothetical protein|nr:hypothetical protein [Flavobacteriales bacterium]
MRIDNSTFFASYNHLYHFHKATLLYHYYQHPDKYFAEVLNPIYTPLERESFFFTNDDVYFKKAIALDMRSTYFHCVETLFNLIGVFKAEAEIHERHGKWLNAFSALTEYAPKQLYNEIVEYGKDQASLAWLAESAGRDQWSLGRHIFFFALSPPAEKIEDYLRQCDASVMAIQLALHLFAKDFDDRKEYDSYKHGLRVLDAMKTFYLLDPQTRKMMVLDAGSSLTFPKKSKGAVEVKTQNVDFVRDYRMCVLGARLIQMMINQRRIFYNKAKMDFEQVPIVMLSEESVRWHSEAHVSNKVELIKLEDFEKKFGFKVNLKENSKEDTLPDNNQ